MMPCHGIWSTQSSYWILLGIIGAKILILLFDYFEFQMAMKCLQLLQLVFKHISLVAIIQNFGLVKYDTMYMSFEDFVNFFQYMSFKLINIIMFVQVMSFLATLLLLLMLEENAFW